MTTQTTTTCPRCRENTLRTPLVMNALCRVSQRYVCAQCNTETSESLSAILALLRQTPKGDLIGLFTGEEIVGALTGDPPRPADILAAHGATDYRTGTATAARHHESRAKDGTREERRAAYLAEPDQNDS